MTEFITGVRCGSFTLAFIVGLSLEACAGTPVPLTSFEPTDDTHSSAVSRADCRLIGLVTAEGRGFRQKGRGHRIPVQSLDDAQNDAIATLKVVASSQGANYVLLKQATWYAAKVIVQGESYRCRTAPLPPLVCSRDDAGLTTCSRH